MGKKFKRIGVIGKFDSPNLSRPLAQVITFLVRLGHSVVVDSRSATQLEPHTLKVADLDKMGGLVDLLLVLGGDGTLLSVARTLTPHKIPLIGINLGRLGFLTDIPADRIEATLTPMLAGEYQQEERLLLNATVVRKRKQVFSTLALNDVVLSRGAMGSMIEFEVYVDGQFAYNLRSDGVIVATPTGSTAYSLSSGGPILHPSLPALGLVPISPHTLSNRPIVIPSTSTVDIVLIRGPNARVNFDVQSHFELEPDDRVTVKAHDDPICLLHPKTYNYYAMLREKLHWSAKL
ncbi:MAG: NAD kinase [Burkholderiales bacterium]